MPKYLVRQRRAMWVAVVQEVEAPDEEAAKNAFCNEFGPQHIFHEGYVQRADPGPVTVWLAEQFPNVEDVLEAD